MGIEVVYCAGCQTRLSGSDFRKGRVAWAESRAYCVKCAPEGATKASLHPKAMGASRPAPFGKTAPSATVHRKAGPAASPEMRKWLILGVGTAGFIFIVVVVFMIVGGDGDGTGTNLLPKLVERPPEAARELLKPTGIKPSRYSKDLDSLKMELAGPLNQGKFRVAKTIIERARERHTDPQWALAIRDMDRDLTTRARTRLRELIEKAASLRIAHFRGFGRERGRSPACPELSRGAGAGSNNVR